MSLVTYTILFGYFSPTYDHSPFHFQTTFHPLQRTRLSSARPLVLPRSSRRASASPSGEKHRNWSPLWCSGLGYGWGVRIRNQRIPKLPSKTPYANPRVGTFLMQRQSNVRPLYLPGNCLPPWRSQSNRRKGSTSHPPHKAQALLRSKIPQQKAHLM